MRAIVSLGSSLGMTVTAEGIESGNDLAYLQAEGCNEGQGYLFSQALPIEEASKLLKSKKKSQAA